MSEPTACSTERFTPAIPRPGITGHTRDQNNGRQPLGAVTVQLLVDLGGQCLCDINDRVVSLCQAGAGCGLLRWGRRQGRYPDPARQTHKCCRGRLKLQSYTYISLNLSRIASSESPLRLPDKRMRTVLISFSLAKSHAASGPMVDVSYFCGRIFSISRLSHQRSNAEADWVSASAGATVLSCIQIGDNGVKAFHTGLRQQGNIQRIALGQRPAG